VGEANSTTRRPISSPDESSLSRVVVTACAVATLETVGEATPEHGDPVRPEQRYFRGIAAVPQRQQPDWSETGELPAARVGGTRRWRSGQVGADAPPGGRWRTWRRGAGWTVAGLWFVVISWGVWAISRGEDLVGSVLAIGVVLATATLVFTVSRLLGRVVLEGSLARQRHTAWPSHLMTFLLLVVGGVGFLQQTWWLVDAWHWLAGNLR
jgi:hypothetical protein